MVVQIHLHERLRAAGLRVRGGGEVPFGHAHVVLRRGQADLLPGSGRVEALVSPSARKLTGQPGVRCLADGHHVLALGPEEHPGIVPLSSHGAGRAANAGYSRPMPVLAGSGLPYNLADIVGGTPMVRLGRVAPECDAELIGKLEAYNPAGA